jgi:hypothetical protein
MAAWSIAHMSRLDEVLRAAKSLEPDDRLRLILQLWESLPPGHWAQPNVDELAEIERRLREGGSRPEVDRRSQESPWEAVLRVLLPQSSMHGSRLLQPSVRRDLFGPPPKLYAATRRFDLATIFVAMAGYSLFFALMTLLEFAPFWKLYFGALIAIVGVGQAMLERVVDPRRASIIVGAATHTLVSLIIWTAAPKYFFFNSFFFVAIFNGVILGGTLGYMAGALVGGVFLVADALRGKFSRTADGDATNGAADDASTAPVHPLDTLAPRNAGP